MKKYIEIKRQGVFYNVYNEDAYIIMGLTKYKITNGRIGFPISSIDRIKNILNENKINYVVIDDDKIEDKKFKNNRYNKYLEIGKTTYKEGQEKESLIKNIDKLSSDKIKEISKYVNYIIYK